MRLEPDGRTHLTYCTNIHPGERWEQVRDNLERYLPEVKARVSPQKPFGIGLRLSNIAAEELATGDHLNQLRVWQFCRLCRRMRHYRG